jgi:type IV pilus assembly protein PilY1
MKIKARTMAGSSSITDEGKNGRWFAVLGSGPTGYIETNSHQFMAKSDQNLKLFILDLKTGALLRTIDTGIANAFSGSISNGTIDYDHDFQDDALYFGYTKKCTDSSHGCTVDTWTDGGVLRLLTRQNLAGSNVSVTGDTALNPNNWQVSAVIDNIGTVTAGIGTAGFTPTGESSPTEGWLFFGTGRYFYKGDDIATQRHLFGIKDQCFQNIMKKQSPYTDNAALKVCDLTNPDNPVAPLALSNLTDATIDVKNRDDNGYTSVPIGWFIKLEHPDLATDHTCLAETNGLENNCKPTAERVITDPLVAPNGAVYYTTFLPSADICDYGGTSYLWAIVYNVGSSAAARGMLKGKAIMQVSTGEIASIDLKTAFETKIAIDHTPDGKTPLEPKGRRDKGHVGSPPAGSGLSVVTAPKPMSKILNTWKK